eukprot:262237-Pelagomonas_calceolata.AAC.3
MIVLHVVWLVTVYGGGPIVLFGVCAGASQVEQCLLEPSACSPAWHLFKPAKACHPKRHLLLCRGQKDLR